MQVVTKDQYRINNALNLQIIHKLYIFFIFYVSSLYSVIDSDFCMIAHKGMAVRH